MLHVVTKMKISINKYSQVFHRVGPSYGGMTKFIIVDHYVVFLEKNITLVSLMLRFI
jgi:hypothetical protein